MALDLDPFSPELVQESGARLPAASADDIFNNGVTARMVFSIFKMDQGAAHWRIDPPFFC